MFSRGGGHKSPFIDSDVKVGTTYDYRLTDGEGSSDAVSFTVVRRLKNSEAQLFFTGTSDNWNYGRSRGPENAFDDDIVTLTECTDHPVKHRIGLDFGTYPAYVAFMRVHPRGNGSGGTHGCTYYTNGMKLYGTSLAGVNVTDSSEGTAVAGPVSGYVDASTSDWTVWPTTAETVEYYRSFYVTDMQNCTTVGEVELYGWLITDVSGAHEIDCDFAVSRSDWENSHAQLTWTAAKTEGAVSVERQISDGEWETLAEDLETGAYTDTTMPYGHTIRYRLSQGENLSKELTFVRMHRLTTTPYTVWSNAKTYWNGQKEDRAFDGQWEVESGDCMSYPDISDSYSERANYPKVGVDFGRATHYVAMVRMFPRTQSNCMYMMNDAVVYGSKRSASQESLDGILGTPVTEKAGGVDEKRWYELAGLKRAEEVEAYRCYYYYHVTGGCANECEFYGWTRDDLTEEIPLNFSVERIDLEDFFPRLSWNDISINGVSVQRRIAGETGWAEIAKIDAGEEPIYEDTKIKYGFLYEYRLVYDGEESEAIAFRRLRRLTPEMGKLFTNSPGPVNDNPSHAAEMAFDGDSNNYVELNRLERGDDRINPKVGIDFGAANVAIEFVRFCPRHEWEGNIHHSHTTILYGSRHTAEEECATLDNATALTEPTTFEDYKFEWQERTVADPQYFRTFYYQGSDNYQAGMAEVELYGWFKTDIIRPFVILVK